MAGRFYGSTKIKLLKQVNKILGKAIKKYQQQNP